MYCLVWLDNSERSRIHKLYTEYYLHVFMKVPTKKFHQLLETKLYDLHLLYWLYPEVTK